MGPSKNSWSNTVTFPFWEGLTVGPVKVPPPSGNPGYAMHRYIQ